MKLKKFINTQDILLINKIMFPVSKLTIIYGAPKEHATAPNEKVVFIDDEAEVIPFLDKIKSPFTLANYASDLRIDPMVYSFMEGILDFSNQSISTYQSYLFINNPDGTIRWFFPTTNKNPCFLHLYNGSGWKAASFVMASKILSKTKGLSILTDGQFSVFHKKNKTFNINFPTESYDEFAVFTGTVGENRKAIIALSSLGKATQFIKIPLTSASEKLVKNEFQQLSHLGKSVFQMTVIPQVKFKDKQIMVSNISPSKKNKNQDWSLVHLKSLEELYTYSYQKKLLIDTSFWNTIKEGILFLQRPINSKNGLSGKDIFSIKKKVEQSFEEIDPNDFYALGIGHGDFTPWNMYVGKTKLHIYDWEMSQADFPLLFDLFHYFFQKGILIQKKNYFTIWEDIQSALTTKEAQDLLAKFDIDLEKHFQLYLLYIVCYYLPKYIAQPKLHEQVHWLIATWLEALENNQLHSNTILSS